MTAETPAERIRTYLNAFPDAQTFGEAIAHSEEFRSADWPRTAYAPTRDDLEAVLSAADAAASYRNAPALRNCLMIGCFREFDIAARMEGRTPARPSWSGDGWHHVRPTVATGYVCPTHAPLIEQHRHRWVERTDDTSTLTCSCSWTSPAARWGGYAVAAWQNHLLVTSDTTETL